MKTRRKIQTLLAGLTASKARQDDVHLVRECLRGKENAWSALIEKYKNLIYSIPFKYHLTPEDAADIFQAVCLELFAELANLRKVGSLRSWLITVTTRKAFHWKHRRRRQEEKELHDWNEEEIASALTLSSAEWDNLEREQMIREAMAQLSPRCQELIQMLFYEHPPLPYREVAKRLGLATGSLGFIRGRCLTRLEKILVEMGFLE